jgi:NhaP-type Na+/H+ or K+/H+ antiporter
VVRVVVVILSTITVQSLTAEWFMVIFVMLSTIAIQGLTEEWFMLLHQNNLNHSPVKPKAVMVDNITTT